MDKKVVLIGDKASFMLKALDMNLRNDRFQVKMTTTGTLMPESDLDFGDIYILYPESYTNLITPLFNKLAENLASGHKYLFVVGNDDEIELLEKLIPRDSIAGAYPRPLNIRNIMGDIERLINPPEHPLEKKNSILLVDDDVTFLKMVKGSLENRYNVTPVSSGMQAITYLANNKPDLILLDFEMSVVSGPQVFQMLKSEPKTADIPVIFLTGKNDKKSIMEVMVLKPQGYILKSVRLPEIVTHINEFFKKQKEMEEQNNSFGSYADIIDDDPFYPKH